MDANKKKALDQAFKQIEKKYGKGSIMASIRYMMMIDTSVIASIPLTDLLLFIPTSPPFLVSHSPLVNT